MALILSLILLVVLFLLLFVIILFFFTIFDLFLELPYVGAKKEMVSKIIKLAQIKKAKGPEGTRRRETVVDLGSGDGRLLFASAAKGARAIGYEINPFLVLLTRLKAHFRGYSSSEVEKFINRGSSPRSRTIKSSAGSVTIIRQNLWKADLAVADVIFVYAKKKTMKKFEDFIFQNAKKGTRVIVNTNPFPTKKPLKSENGILLYRIERSII